MICKYNICTGSGFNFEENSITHEMEAVPCRCRLDRDEQLDDERYKRKLLEAGISPVFWNLTLNSYRALVIGSPGAMQVKNTIIKTIEEFIDEPDKFINNYNTLWLWSALGNSGCTSLAIIFAMELIKKNYRVKFITMQNLLNAFVEFDNKKIYFKDLEFAQIYILDNAFVSGRCHVKGEYTGVQLYNWLNEGLIKDKRFICTSRVELVKADKIYEHSAGVLRKRALSLEIQGTLP